MYVRTENGKVIEIYEAIGHIHELTDRDTDYYEGSNYGKPDVKPIKETPSWQLFWKNLIGGKEICIATFDSVKEANDALSSIRFIDRTGGWDAIEYKRQCMYVKAEDGEVIVVHVANKDIHELTDYDKSYYEHKNYGKPDVKPVERTSSWQLCWKNFFGGKEICIATFDSVKEANDALSSIRFTDRNGGWDAIEYKRQLNSA